MSRSRRRREGLLRSLSLRKPLCPFANRCFLFSVWRHVVTGGAGRPTTMERDEIIRWVTFTAVA